jgi:hypothetical protein
MRDAARLVSLHSMRFDSMPAAVVPGADHVPAVRCRTRAEPECRVIR